MGPVFLGSRISDTYYIFLIDDINQSFWVSVHQPAGWENIIQPTVSSFIRKNDTNHVAVLGDNSKFVLFINGHYVGNFKDDRFVTGYFGVGAYFPGGENAEFEFDNFELTR